MKSILLVKKLLGLVEMTSGLVNVSFSLPEWQAVKRIFFAPCVIFIYKRQKQTLDNSKVRITVVKFRGRRRDTEPSLLGWHRLAVQLLEPHRATAPYAPLSSVNDKRDKFISCNKLLFLVSFLCRRSNWSEADPDNVNWKCFLFRNARNHRKTCNQANIRNPPPGWNSCYVFL